MREIYALALAYDAVQDRILAVVNPGSPSSWAYWLTRRLVLQMLGRLPAHLLSRSDRAVSTPAEFGPELAAFQKDAALVHTAGAMTTTAPTVMQMNAATAELAVSVSVDDASGSYRVALTGERGSAAAGILATADLLRILHMLEQELTKAGWSAVEAPGSAATPAPPPAPRRLN